MTKKGWFTTPVPVDPKLFGFPVVKPDGKIEQKHCNLAYAIQNVTEEIVLKMAKEAKKVTGSDYLCMAGGVALNCVANGKLVVDCLFILAKISWLF